MYEAQHWHDDPAFHAPMVTCENSMRVFAGDIVLIKHEDCVLFAKITKFFQYVSLIILKSTLSHVNLFQVEYKP